MPVKDYDFYDSPCGSQTTVADDFGIHDELDNDIPAYLVFDEEKVWMLRVSNVKNIEILFYPIDNCIKILKEGTNNKDSLCDGFLLYKDVINFVELAESRHKSTEKCINQLRSTIEYFKKKHVIDDFSKKTAIVSNIKKITSSVSFERQEDFKNETGFTLYIKTTLNI
ncbi:hypothetical protein [Flavobacterium sp.]|uniref:hypothetical protein n=1 Tax=Flavobacterium sp. TaxID=239 RepID=UPI0040482228